MGFRNASTFDNDNSRLQHQNRKMSVDASLIAQAYAINNLQVRRCYLIACSLLPCEYHGRACMLHAHTCYLATQCLLLHVRAVGIHISQVTFPLGLRAPTLKYCSFIVNWRWGASCKPSRSADMPVACLPDVPSHAAQCVVA